MKKVLKHMVIAALLVVLNFNLVGFNFDNRPPMIGGEVSFKSIVWKQRYVFADNKSIKIDLNNDKKMEYVDIGMEVQAGSQVSVFINGSKFNLFYDSKLCKNTDLVDDESGDIKEGMTMQVAFYDFDGDKKPEIIIALGDRSITLGVSIFKNNGSKKGNPYKEIGYIEGQENIRIDKTKHIEVPYGSQGLFAEYKYANGKFIETEAR